METNEPMDAIYKRTELGCHADGTYGHGHVREVMRQLMQRIPACPLRNEIMKSLEGEMPDDAWDEQEALDWLNTYTEDNLLWELYEGDLLLSEVARYSED